MIFEQDLYISFAKADNQPVDDQSQGWVSNFERFLEILLSQLLSRKVNIILSSETDASYNVAGKSCAMICVVTKDYLASQNYKRDFSSFTPDVLNVNGKDRIFKVLKSYVPQEELPHDLSSLSSYELFNYDSITGSISEFKSFTGEDSEKSYWLRLVDLCYDIYKLISANSASKADLDVAGAGNKENIYLADTSKNMGMYREIIRRELEMFGYHILPEKMPDTSSSQVEQSIQNDLNRCQLSIHIIGEDFITENETEETKVVKLENKIASEYASRSNNGKSKFKRLLWIPPDMRYTSEKQKIAIENFKRDTALLHGAEVLQIPIEEFKSIIKTQLDAKSGGNVSASTADWSNSIYFIVDSMDMESSKSLREMLKNNGLNVVLPQYDGEVLDIRKNHQLSLNNCDAVLVYSDKVSELWVKSKILDIMKAPGFGRRKPLLGKMLIASKEARLDENYYKNNKVALIRSDLKNYSPEILNSFISKIKSK